MPRRIARWCLLLSCLLAGPVLAWGERGHRLVGTLAQERLSPAARAEVDRLLAGERDPGLAGVATWADAMRERREWRWTAPLHYVRIHDRACRYDAARDCRDGACVVGAIAHYAAQLADRTQTRERRAEALKFVVHFVADVHQPLHSGWRDDKGGNDFQVSLLRRGRPEGSNLHSVWDHFILAGAGESLAEQAERLRAAGAAEAGARLAADDAVRWAEASCALTAAEGFYPPRPGRLPDGYLERQRPLAERRLREAAAALAALLEASLAPR